MSFPQSNGAYCQVFRGENQECLLQGLQNIINYMNKVPFRMVFDNLSAAVVHVGIGKERILTEGFMRFTEHYGIETVFCSVDAGWEKGNVENKVGYERRNMFIPVPTIIDFDQFNKRLFECCELEMQRKHYRKGLLIAELFEADKKAMLPVNPVDFKVCRFQTAKADKFGKITFETNRYSSSPRLAQDTVYLEIASDTVTILDSKYNKIVTHRRIYDKNEESMDWLPYISLMAKQPYALKYTGFYQELPVIWQNYLSELSPDKKREALQTLDRILQKHSMEMAVDALEIALHSGVKDSDSILASYHRLTSKAPQLPPIHFSNPNIQLPSFQTDNSSYDTLFEREASK